MRKFYENWSALDCNSASTLAELQVKDNQGDTNSASALADISSVATDELENPAISNAEMGTVNSLVATKAPTVSMWSL
jgi:hypothetical protein